MLFLWGARWEPHLVGGALCLTCDFSPPEEQ